MQNATSWKTSDETSEPEVCLKNVTSRDVRVPILVPCHEEHTRLDAVTGETRSWTITQKEIAIVWKPGEARMVPRHVWRACHRVKNCGHGEPCRAFCIGDPLTIAESGVLGSGMAPAQLVLVDPQSGEVVQRYQLHRSLMPVIGEEVPKTISPQDLASAQRAIAPAVTMSDHDPVMQRARARRAAREQS